jgi:hypothetical protein
VSTDSRRHRSAHARAALHLLQAPIVARRARPFAEGGDVACSELLDEADELMSPNQALLVHAAHDLATGFTSVGLRDLTRRLDEESFAYVLSALAIAREWDEPRRPRHLRVVDGGAA